MAVVDDEGHDTWCARTRSIANACNCDRAACSRCGGKVDVAHKILGVAGELCRACYDARPGGDVLESVQRKGPGTGVCSDCGSSHGRHVSNCAQAKDLARRESLLARIAGNVASGMVRCHDNHDPHRIACQALDVAECIIATIEQRRSRVR